jgi:ATP-dependent protease ClpP protease subunit
MSMIYNVTGEGTDTLELEIFDYIGGWGGITARDVLARIKENKQATTIKLRVNSGGGDVFDGLAIRTLLAQHPARVEAYVTGLAASIASVIIMAADKIYIEQSAAIMIHNSSVFAGGGKEDLVHMAELLGKIDGQIADLYVARTGMKRDDVVALMNAETWMFGQEAKDKGFADEMVPNKTPEDDVSALAGLDITGFANVPQVFAQAVSAARQRAPITAARAARTKPQDSAGAQPSGTESPQRAADTKTKETVRMTLEELKDKHPALYAQIVKEARAEGAKAERERAEAHLIMGEKCGDMSIAVAAIKEGADFGAPLVQAKYLAAGMDRRDVMNRQADSDDAGRATAGLRTTELAPEPESDVGDQIMALQTGKPVNGGK